MGAACHVKRRGPGGGQQRGDGVDAVPCVAVMGVEDVGDGAQEGGAGVRYAANVLHGGVGTWAFAYLIVLDIVQHTGHALIQKL